MLDASRAVVVVQALLDPNNKKEYMQDIRKEYAGLRQSYLDSQQNKSYAALAKARAKGLKTDWQNVKITKPAFLGTRTYLEFDLNKLIPFIDWDPFF